MNLVSWWSLINLLVLWKSVWIKAFPPQKYLIKISVVSFSCTVLATNPLFQIISYILFIGDLRLLFIIWSNSKANKVREKYFFQSIFFPINIIFKRQLIFLWRESQIFFPINIIFKKQLISHSMSMKMPGLSRRKSCLLFSYHHK